MFHPAVFVDTLVRLIFMRAIVLSVCLLVIATPGIAQVAASDQDRLVVQTVLMNHAVPELVGNWGVERDVSEVILADELLQCQLPVGHVESARVSELLNRSAQGMEIDEEDLRYRAPSPDADLEVTMSRIVPRTLVRRCQSAGVARLRSIEVSTEIPVVLEDAAVIRRSFRRDPVRWKEKHPLAAGVITFGRPVYSDDGQMAAVSYTRFRNGIGGGIFFCLLTRSHSAWDVLWQETILIE